MKYVIRKIEIEHEEALSLINEIRALINLIPDEKLVQGTEFDFQSDDERINIWVKVKFEYYYNDPPFELNEPPAELKPVDVSIDLDIRMTDFWGDEIDWVILGQRSINPVTKRWFTRTPLYIEESIKEFFKI